MLALEWNHERNAFGPHEVTPGSNRRVWWRDALGHEWEAVIASRSSGAGCGVCSRERAASLRREARPGRSLLELSPALAAELHPVLSADVNPSKLPASTRRVFWWLGDCGHEWQQSVSQRYNNGVGCSVCSGWVVVPGTNDLATTHPRDAAEWHPELNGELSTSSVTAGSERKAWWLGACGHHWSSTILSRTNGTGACPFCTGRRVLVGFNDLRTVRPDLAAEWHPSLNGERNATSVTRASQFHAWWRGAAGHTWKATVGNRTVLGTGCSECKKSGTSGAEAALFDALADLFEKVEQGARIEDARLGRFQRVARVDVLLRADGRRIAVEYDGSYWHADRAKNDDQKTDALIAAGLTVVRIREQPLPLLKARAGLLQLTHPWAPSESSRGRKAYEEIAQAIFRAVSL
jgi:hypothetical protein